MNISKDNLTQTAPFQGLRLIGIITIVAGHAGFNLVGGGGNWCTFFFILSGFLYKTQINNWHFPHGDFLLPNWENFTAQRESDFNTYLKIKNSMQNWLFGISEQPLIMGL